MGKKTLITGTIDEIGVGRVGPADVTYTYIKVDGERYENICVPDTLDRIISTGNEVSFVVSKGLFFMSRMIAAGRDSSGDVVFFAGKFKIFMTIIAVAFLIAVGAALLAFFLWFYGYSPYYAVVPAPFLWYAEISGLIGLEKALGLTKTERATKVSGGQRWGKRILVLSCALFIAFNINHKTVHKSTNIMHRFDCMEAVQLSSGYTIVCHNRGTESVSYALAASAILGFGLLIAGSRKKY